MYIQVLLTFYLPVQYVFIRFVYYLNHLTTKTQVKISYLFTYELYGPVRNAFDVGSIHYEGK
jgi:hypothetical protein